MKSLVINAPAAKVKTEGRRSFEDTLAKRIGEGYAIAQRLADQCEPGCGVVLLSQDGKKRAEGKLVKLEPTQKAGNGMQRYDVHMADLHEVPYQREALNRNGVAIIEIP